MFVNLIASFIATLSMAAQPQDIPQRFERCIERRGHTVITSTFIGRECIAKDGETWYAGLDLESRLLVTGP